MKKTELQDRSWPMAFLQIPVKPFGALITKPGKPLPGGSPQLTAHASATKSCNISERQVEDMWIYDVTAKAASDSTATESVDATDRRVYCIGGGSFCMPPSSDHWKFCAALANSIPNAVISIISPPLAPNNPAPTAFPQLTQLF